MGKKQIPNEQLLMGAVVVLLVVIGVGGYIFYTNNVALQEHIDELNNELVKTQKELAATMNDRAQLNTELRSQQDKVTEARKIISEVTDTVENLEKLNELEPELLQKYSKVYFLNEHYTPEEFKDIKEKFLYNEEEPEKVDARVWPFLNRLLQDAQDDNIELYVASAYRSFDEQQSLKAGYTVTYGSGANTFSADQGYSEHQLGTTVDFMTTGIGGTLDGFENTEAYEWLRDHAYQYGFILSYPPNNTYYVFEPWHWRFVGEDLAHDLHRDKISFYDMPQRAIDEYLIKTFDAQ